MTEPEPNFAARVEVSDGRRLLGAFSRNARGFIAADAAGRRIGEFATRAEAVRAITAHANKSGTVH